MYVGPHVHYPLFLSDFNKTLIFSTDLKKKSQISNVMKICPVGAKLFHADGRTDGKTDMTNQIFAFHNFANGP